MDLLTNLFLGMFIILSISMMSLTYTKENSQDYFCATLELEMCELSTKERNSCPQKSELLSWTKGENLSSKVFSNISKVLSISSGEKCSLTVCDNDNQMGYCAQFPPKVQVAAEKFEDILQPGTVGAHCSCTEDVVNGSLPYSDEEFDRNYFGVIYSPYGKFSRKQPNKQNNTLHTYSEDDITKALKEISKKFTYIASYHKNRYFEWNNDAMEAIPEIAAKLNRDQNHLALRVAFEVYRIDDIIDGDGEWKSHEISNAVEIARNANQIFNGTVWGLIIDVIDANLDVPKADIILEMIRKFKAIITKDNLHLKVGLRHSCGDFEMLLNDTSEDYLERYGSKETLETIKKKLYSITNNSDFIICHNPLIQGIWSSFMPHVILWMKTAFERYKNIFRQINSNLKIIVETGAPSGFNKNDFAYVKTFTEYWKSMAKFAKENHMMFHMKEAFDQLGEGKINPQYGWWRYNKTNPPVYIEKYKELEQPENHLSTTRVYLKPKESEDGNGNLFKIVAICFIGFGVAVVSIVILLWRKLYAAKRQIISPALINQFHSGGEDDNRITDTGYVVALKIPYNREYEMAKENFHIEKNITLGEGHYGVVHRGTIQKETGTIQVAFKCTSPDSNVVGIIAIMSEIKILCYLGKHDNLVCILGAYTKKIQRGIIYMALEFCPLGCVGDFLRKAKFIDAQTVESGGNQPSSDNETSQTRTCAATKYVTLESMNTETSFELEQVIPKEPLNILTLVMWCEQIASAMDYVSGMKVVHADLSAKNVLLHSINQAKVADFGLSKKMYQELEITHDNYTPLPWRWMAPESLKHLSFSSQSDVWSYGVTLWEIFSLGEVPYHGRSYDSEFLTQLMEGERLSIAKHAPLSIFEEMKKCWELDPTIRPNFKELQQFFNGFITENGNILHIGIKSETASTSKG